MGSSPGLAPGAAPQPSASVDFGTPASKGGRAAPLQARDERRDVGGDERQEHGDPRPMSPQQWAREHASERTVAVTIADPLLTERIAPNIGKRALRVAPERFGVLDLTVAEQKHAKIAVPHASTPALMTNCV